MSLVLNVMLFLNCYMFGRLITADLRKSDIEDLYRDGLMVSGLNVAVYFLYLLLVR